ncbi:MAG TPA: hypothetical protein VGY54_18110 [Polyangiaceae bacterium]|nr:hypothetical protein [Polyangiaceae bacterium]
MTTNAGDGVWIFLGERARFPSAVFRSLEKAEACIAENRFSGLLTWYPLDELSYDWATRTETFMPKKDHKKTREFRQEFVSSIHHYHYEDGKRRA